MIKFCLIIAFTMAASLAQAKSWERLQYISENRYIGETWLTPGVVLNSPVTKVILNRVDNPIESFGHVIERSMMERDQDLVEIFLIPETGNSIANCYLYVFEGLDGEEILLLKECSIIDRLN